MGLGHCCCVAGASSDRRLPGPSQPSQMARLGALKGCWFTLTALEEGEDIRDAKDMIVQNGGRLFAQNTHQLVVGKPPETIFAMCPMGLPAHRLDTLRRQRDFQLGECSE